MARDAYIDNRLHNWCRWKLSQGSGALGYARVDLGEPVVDGGREGYDTPARIPIDDVEASITDEGVQLLIPELRRTVEVYYLHPGSVATRLALLACGEATMYARLWRVDRVLSAWLSERERAIRAERRRVETLQQR